MPVWLQFAWQEYKLPFQLRHLRGGCPGGRDFVWLTIFMIAIIFNGALLHASYEGLVNKFVDTLVGYVPQHGVPVSISNNIFSKNIHHTTLTTSVIDEIDGMDETSVFPYMLIGSGDTSIQLPGEDVWLNKAGKSDEVSEKIGPGFQGWAVYTDDPLWIGKHYTNQLPLEIILSRKLFARYFKYEQYRDTLKTVLPAPIFEKLPAAVDWNAEEPFKTLWLRLKFGPQPPEHHAFRVIWQNRIPVIDNIAFLFPLSTFNALRVANHNPNVSYYPENQDKKRIAAITLMPAKLTQTHKQFLLKIGIDSSFRLDTQVLENLKQDGLPPQIISKLELIKDVQFTEQPKFEFKLMELLGEQNALKYKALILQHSLRLFSSLGAIQGKLKYPLPQSWLDAYAEEYGVTYEIDVVVRNEVFLSDRMIRVQAPVEKLDKEFMQKYGQIKNEGGILIDMAKTDGFRHAIVYIKDRTAVTQIIEKLKTIADEAVAIPMNYDDAIKRFGFLNQILSVMKRPYFWVMIFIAVFLLFVILSSLIGHRRKSYGVFLTKGIALWQIYAMLFFQILCATTVGMIASYFIINIAAWVLRSTVREVIVKYTDIISNVSINLLPISFLNVFLISGFIFLLTIAIAFSNLFVMTFKARTHPARLLQ